MSFFTLNPADPKIFGFAEYIAALALMVLAWTTVDYRYRFHVETARYDVRRIAFTVIAAVGLLTLITDVWRASAWPVWQFGPITPVVWQGILGAIFLATFVTWSRIAFVRPPIFNVRNANRFLSAVLREIKRGDKAQVALMADALVPSAPSVIRLLRKQDVGAERMLSLLSDPLVCSVIVSRSPSLLFALYDEVDRAPVSSRGIYTLTTNVLNAAIGEKDSFLHREVRDWTHGAASSTQSITSVVFGNLRLLEQLPGIFNQVNSMHWTLSEWQAFFRASGMALGSYIDTVRDGQVTQSFTVNNIFHVLKDAPGHIRRNLESGRMSTSEAAELMRALITVIREVGRRIDQTPATLDQWRGLGEFSNPVQHLAAVAYQVLLGASYVKSPADEAWHFGYSIAWAEIFDPFQRKDSEATFDEVQELVARMLWVTISELDRTPNFVGTQILGLCISIGLVTDDVPSRSERSITPQATFVRLLTAWVRRRYAWLYKYHHVMAVAGFADGVTYDRHRRTISRQHAVNAFRAEPSYTLFKVDAAPKGDSESHIRHGRKRTFSPPNNRRKIPDVPWI